MKQNKARPEADPELRRRAEELLKKKKGKARQPLKDEEMLRLIHELQVHQIELEMQNEELLKSREEVEVGLQRYTDLYDFSPVGYFSLSKDGSILSVNLTGSAILGLERSHLLRRRFGQFVSGEARRSFTDFIKKLFETSEKGSCEVPMIKEDKQPFVAHIEAAVPEDENECLAAVTDITGRKKTEVELKASETRYRRLFETAEDGIFIVDAHTEQIIDVNPSLTKMLGSPAMEFLGKKVFEVDAFSDCTTLRNSFSELYKKGHFKIGHLRIKTKEGHMLDLEFSGRGYFDEHNKVIQCNMRDIALRSRAEEALKNTYDQLDLRVKERTEDLLEANQQLVGEIAERRKAEDSLRETLGEIRQLKAKLSEENIYLKEEFNLSHSHKEIVGNSEVIRQVLRQIEQVATTESTVLIQGETGTGKELVANAIHSMSSRKDRLMIKVNCAALPPTLIESELFGREKGAFTGSLSKQIGRFELADASTIFLDEIDALPLDLQAKLLRVLESGEFERLGNPRTVKVDVRIITATNSDLARVVGEGGFREDLYYRLNVFQIIVPPLRERQEDILPLVWSFVQELSKRMGKRIESIPQNDVKALQAYPWPGNVRELRNVIERAMIITTGAVLHLDMPRIAQSCTEQPVTLEEVEKRRIVEVLNTTGWKVSGKGGAAEILGINPKTLESRMQRLGIQRNKNI